MIEHGLRLEILGSQPLTPGRTGAVGWRASRATALGSTR
jgi:hypothetical protein